MQLKTQKVVDRKKDKKVHKKGKIMDMKNERNE